MMEKRYREAGGPCSRYPASPDHGVPNILEFTINLSDDNPVVTKDFVAGQCKSF